MVKVSVILPVYNGEKYLMECLDSIANQTLSDIEIICINDGSTDNSLDILNNYAKKDNRFKITDIPNHGQSAARNLGITEACGEYIGFVDCDDYIDNDYYEKLYNTAVKYNADIAMASVFRIRKKRNRYFLKLDDEKIYNTTEQKYKAANLPKSCYVWNKIYKRSAYINSFIKFTEGKVYEDIEFNHKVLHKLGCMVTAPKTKYYYRDNPHSTINIYKTECSEDYRYAMNQAVKYIQDNNIKYDLFKYPPEKRVTGKFLGIPLFKIKEWAYGKKTYLLGICTNTKKTVE